MIYSSTCNLGVLFQNVMSMNEEDERKMEEVRKFSAIYGRFDCKRKPEKPLTLHEVLFWVESKKNSCKNERND